MDYLFRNKPSRFIDTCGTCKNPIAPQDDRWCAAERVVRDGATMTYQIHIRCDPCFKWLEAISAIVQPPQTVLFPLREKHETQKEPPAGNREVPGERVYVPETDGGLSASLMVDNKRMPPTL